MFRFTLNTGQTHNINSEVRLIIIFYTVQSFDYVLTLRRIVRPRFSRLKRKKGKKSYSSGKYKVRKSIRPERLLCQDQILEL